MPSSAGGSAVGRLPAPAELGLEATWGLREGDPLGATRTVLARLGSGRKSEVYLAWDRARRSTVAAKLLLPGDSIRRLQREAQLLERLRHPLLVRGLDAELDGPRPHLALEHIEGPSLRDLVRRGAVAPEVVAAIGHQMATVLHYLASEGMVHLDVRPQNVLLAPHSGGRYLQTGRRPALAGARKAAGRSAQGGGHGAPVDALPVAKLIDVGAVKPAGGPTKGAAGDVPEHDGPEAPVTPAAAVWILGSTLRRALGGGERGDGSPLPVTGARASGALEEVITACLREAPSERPSPEEVALALEPLMELSAHRTDERRGRRWRWRWRWLHR